MEGSRAQILPLTGFTVVSLEHAIAALLASRQLADLGARVIKVERPGDGDFARHHLVFCSNLRGLKRTDLSKALRHFAFCNGGIVIKLKPGPKIVIETKITGKPESRIYGDCSFTSNDLANPNLADPNVFRQSIGSNSHRFKELMLLDFARPGVRNFPHDAVLNGSQ